MLVLVTLLGLVFASLAIGALAAHWPFWTRALAWQRSAIQWPAPASLAGSWQRFEPAPAPLSLRLQPDTELAALAGSLDTDTLLVGSAGSVRAWFAQGHSSRSQVDGRGLSPVVPLLLLGTLAPAHPDLLERPLGEVIAAWRDDPRGAITPRQLLWQLSGLPAGPFRPLNPFSAQAMLRSGPDFTRAALSIEATYPPGSHFERAPVNAQLLALVAEQLQQRPWAELVGQLLWERMAAQPADGLLDHRRGTLAAHCCFVAAAEDWLRLGLLVAGHGHDTAQGALVPPQFLSQVPGQSPVHPGQGLGFEVHHDAAGHVYLVLQTTGRLLAALPGRGRALFWSGGELDAGARQRLLEQLLQ